MVSLHVTLAGPLGLLVSLGCHMEFYWLGSLNKEPFSQLQRIENPESVCSTLLSDEALLLGLWTAAFLLLGMGQKDNELRSLLRIRALMPAWEPYLMISTISHLQIPPCMGFGFQHMDSEGSTAHNRHMCRYLVCCYSRSSCKGIFMWLMFKSVKFQ